MGFGTVIWFIPPMVARFLYGDAIMAQDVENPANSSYAYIARELLPNGLMGVMIAAMFAATMSAMDSGLNAQVGIIARNIVPPLRRFFGRTEDMSPKAEVLMCKLLTLALGGLIITYSILFTLNKELILFDAYLTVNSIIGIPLVFPLLIGMWVKKIPRWSYFSIFGFCMIPSLYSLYMNTVHGVSHTIQDRALWIFIFGFIGTLVSLPFYKRSPAAYKKQVREFFEQMHTPIDYQKEIGLSRTHIQLVILGRVSVATGLVLGLLLLVPNTFWARVGVFSVAGFSILIGLLLLLGARAEKRREDAEKARLAALESK
jgi:Na+/proline symporter